MIKKNVKIFETGNFPQGEFNAERVAEIFANTAEGVTAQFAHTSKVKKANKNPLDLGEFSGFRLDDGTIYADVEFNEKGEQYYEDGIINACSVEIANNEITRVAILPINEAPQINGAEFDTNGTMVFGGEMEFAEEFAMAPADISNAIIGLDMATIEEAEFSAIQDAVWEKSDEKYAVNRLVTAGYTVEKKPSEFANMSPEEMQKEIEAKLTREFNAKTTGAEKFNKLKKDGKITPAMEQAGMTLEFMQMLEAQEGQTVEFSKGQYEFASVMKKVIDAIPGMVQPSVTQKGLKPNDGTGKDELSPSEQLKGLKL
jgi:hypothetical protein